MLGFSRLSNLFIMLVFMLGSTGVAGISLRAGPATGQLGLAAGRAEELLLLDDPSWLGLGLGTDLPVLGYMGILYDIMNKTWDICPEYIK